MIELKSKWSTHTSTGMVSKGIYNIDGKEYFVKGNSEEGYFEPYSEVIASRAAKLLNIDLIQYDILPKEYFKEIKVYGLCKHVSICKKINSNLYQFFNTFKLRGYRNINTEPLRVYKEVGLSQEHLWKMLLIDAFVGNQDRHLNNFDIMYENNKLINAPILDTGASCLFNKRESELEVYSGDKIGPDKSKPFKDTHYKQIFLMKRELNIDFNILKDTNKEKFFENLWKECKSVFSELSYKRVKAIKSYLWQRYDVYIEPYKKKQNKESKLEWN